MNTRIGGLNVRYSTRGIPSYSIELWHDGLNKHRIIKGESEGIVRRKVEIQVAEWRERWSIISYRNDSRIEKSNSKKYQEQQKAIATERTANAEKEISTLSSLLAATLSVNDQIDWESLKDRNSFLEPAPTITNWLTEPHHPKIDRQPQQADSKYHPALNFFDRLIKSRKEYQFKKARELFDRDHADWVKTAKERQSQYLTALRMYQTELAKLNATHEQAVTEWEDRKNKFFEQQAAVNAEIDKNRVAYLQLEPSAVMEYCDLVLSNSQYPNYLPKEFELEYLADSKILIVDYLLPAPENLPTLKSVKFIANKDGFEEQYLTDAQVIKLYDDALYQITLRTIHELLEADTANALAAIVFNGIVTAVNRSTGKQVTACILSLQINKDEFLAINLAQVEPKACFKSLKGVGSSKLHGLSPIPPIMQLKREDHRFISSYEVANALDDEVNLAAMDWQDFEHLIREIFEKEFSESGGEVKVTQASRDGGVDAIAFDPDPIRGGKIVIQAKRYTNTVNVSAVRDLYGTVMNEGANKGILVTTSDFGPDSYAFAKEKPLTLLNGSNLLHMLEKHGHKARINLKEAKSLTSK